MSSVAKNLGTYQNELKNFKNLVILYCPCLFLVSSLRCDSFPERVELERNSMDMDRDYASGRHGYRNS